MRIFYSLVFAVLFITGFSSCRIINPSEPVPTYVRIDSFSFSSDINLTGSNSHKITNVWVYFNNSPVGNFDLPAQFPVIAEAAGTLTVAPGFDYNGLSGYPTIYPLYTADNISLAPSPGNVMRLTPRTGYNVNAKMRFDERFDAGAISFTKRDGDTTIAATNNPAKIFEGSGSGIITLTQDQDSAVVQSLDIFTIPKGVDAYIELNYKSDVPMRVLMYSQLKLGGEISRPMIGLKANTAWTKVYIDIKNFVAANEGNFYRIILKAEKPAGQAAGESLIDNVKVISY